jgi:transposase
MKKSTSKRVVLAPQLSIGIDLGCEESHACVVQQDGSVVAQMGFVLTREEVTRLFGGREPAVFVLETCTVSNWVARLLEELGHEVLVCNPRRLKLIAASTLKTDKLDAQVLARMARLAQLDPTLVHAVTVRARSTQLLRSELKSRDQLVAMRTQAINFVRGVLRADALAVPSCDADRFVVKVKLETLPAEVRCVIEPQVQVIASISNLLATANRRIHEAGQQLPGVERMTSIDGVGMLTAVAYTLCIEEPKRFTRSREVGPYLGLIPRVRQSGDQELRGPITKQGDASVRRLLVQAALCLLRCKRDSALKRWTLAVAARSGRKKAIVGLARKLAVLMHHVWVTGEMYQPFPNRLKSAAA